jgi:hypothetical protein
MVRMRFGDVEPAFAQPAGEWELLVGIGLRQRIPLPTLATLP